MNEILTSNINNLGVVRIQEYEVIFEPCSSPFLAEKA